MEHKANPQPGGKPKTLLVKQPWWSSDEPFEVVLVPRQHYTEEYKGKAHEVYLPDANGEPGVWLGTVEKYSGSISTKIAGTRLSRSGATRTLWTKRAPGNVRADFENNSRADVIRSLKENHERKSR